MAADGNAYFERPLEEGETVTWAEDLYDPWGDGSALGRAAEFTTVVEAIQRDHVAPELSSEAPWGDAAVERCVTRRSYP